MSGLKGFLCPCVYSDNNEITDVPLNYSRNKRIYGSAEADVVSINNDMTPSHKQKLVNNQQETAEIKSLESTKNDLFHEEDDNSDLDWEFLDSIEAQWQEVPQITSRGIIKSFISIFPKKKNESDILEDDSHEKDSFVKLPSEDQSVGVTRTYNVEFKGIRNKLLENYGKDSDRLMSRLNCLCTKKVVKKVKGIQKFKEECRKNALEHEVCPNCRVGFCLGRKHSCKVCAGVICQNCSKFLNIDIARSIRKPTSDNTEEYEAIIHIQTTSIQFNNVRGAKTDIRLCHKCYAIVEFQIRKCAQDVRLNEQCVDLYEHLAKLKGEVAAAVDTYDRMCKCFMEGEEISRQDMQQLSSLIKCQVKEIHALSDRIAKLPAQPDSRQAKVQQWIRYAAIQYLHEIQEILRKHTADVHK